MLWPVPNAIIHNECGLFLFGVRRGWARTPDSRFNTRKKNEASALDKSVTATLIFAVEAAAKVTRRPTKSWVEEGR